jgi:hypothetical protein
MLPSIYMLQSKCEVFNYFKKFDKVPSIEVLSQKTLVNKKNFSSLIITNMKLRFEPCVLNLI